MKIKKSKHVHHDRGYTLVVNCKLTSRRISHYATSTSYQKLNDYVAHGEMERVPRVNGCFRPTPGHFGR